MCSARRQQTKNNQCSSLSCFCCCFVFPFALRTESSSSLVYSFVLYLIKSVEYDDLIDYLNAFCRIISNVRTFAIRQISKRASKQVRSAISIYGHSCIIIVQV